MEKSDRIKLIELFETVLVNHVTTSELRDLYRKRFCKIFREANHEKRQNELDLDYPCAAAVHGRDEL